MARRATGVDIGSRTAVFLRGEVKGNSFAVTEFALSEHRESDVTAAWAAADPGFKATAARVGLTGRDVNVRYSRVPRLPDWQLRKLMRFEVEEVGGSSGVQVASDFNVLPELPEVEGEDVVLLAMARESLLEEHAEGLASAGGKLDAFSPNTLALYNAWLRYGVVMDDTVLVADIGHENVDAVLVRGTDLLFARNLTGGSRMFDEAIAQRFDLGMERAEEIKRRLVSVDPRATFDDPRAEKASRAVLGAAGQLLSLLQSTVAFARSQVKVSGLEVDRCVLSGGGAALEGLDRYLAGGLGVPVERFDPFQVVDDSELDTEARARLEEHGLESVVALGLATMGSDPDAYSVEVLPEGERKRRAFWGGTIHLIAAGVLALVFLGALSYGRQQELGEVREEAAKLQARWRRDSSNDKRTTALQEENAELAALAHELSGLTGAGEQAARFAVAVARHMPRDFWGTSFTSTWGTDPELGIARGAERPLLHLEGRTREGTGSVSAAYREFVEGLQAAIPEMRFKDSLSNTGGRFTVDATLLAPPEPVAGDEGTGEEER
jgi:type IV pilus assembly protein PilM